MLDRAAAGPDLSDVLCLCSSRLCLLVLSHDAKRNCPDLGKLGQTPKEEHKSLVCEPGRAEQTGQGTKWRGNWEGQRGRCSAPVLNTRGHWGSVGLVLGAQGMLWRSKAQLIPVDVEFLQIQPKCAAATRQPTQEKRNLKVWIVVLESRRCWGKSPLGDLLHYGAAHHWF